MKRRGVGSNTNDTACSLKTRFLWYAHLCMALAWSGLCFPGIVVASAGYGERAGNSSVKFSPDSKMIAFAYGDYWARPIRLIDVDTGRMIRTLPIERGSVSDLSFSPNGDLLAASITFFVEPPRGVIRVWDIPTGIEVAHKDARPVYFIDFLADNKTIAYNAGGDVELWNLKDETTQKGEMSAIEFSHSADFPGGSFASSSERGLIATAERIQAAPITISSMETDQKIPGPPVDGVVKSLFFNTTGEMLAVLVEKGKIPIEIWDTRTWTRRHSFRAEGQPNDGTFSTDGKLLAVHLDDNVLRIWDLTTSTEIGSVFLLMPPEQLMEAAQKGEWDTVQALISAGVDIETRNPYDGRTVLLSAGMAGRWDIVMQLLESGADVNGPDFGRHTLLMTAVGRTDLVLLLLESGAAVNARDAYGRTALMWAGMGGNLGTVEALLAADADESARDERGWDVLTHAASNGHVEIVMILDREKLNIDYALAWASTKEIADILISEGADVNTRIPDRMNETALSRAAQIGRVELARTLISVGADLNVLRDDKLTPLMLAAREGHLEIVRLLLDAGADVNVRNSEGQTVLSLLKARAEKSGWPSQETEEYEEILDMIKAREAIE